MSNKEHLEQGELPVKKFVYPNKKTIIEKLRTTSLMGKSVEVDQFYEKLADILGDLWSPIHSQMGVVESFAWDIALLDSGMMPVGSDLGSFSIVFKSLREEDHARTIIARRKKILKEWEIKRQQSRSASTSN